MNDSATRRRRISAGVLAGAVALSVMPVLGLTGTAGAADEPPPVAEPIGEGNVCEDVTGDEPFTDVATSDPSYDEIVCLFHAEITEGKATTPPTYDPAGTLTRRQMAMFLKRLADTADAKDLGENVAPLPEYDGEADYSDIADEPAAFKEAIGQLSQAEIALGFGDGTYGPAATLERRQMAKFISRTLEYLTGDELDEPSGDYFDDDEGDSGEEEFNQLAELGIFLGDGQGSVDPGGDLSRRQMANVLTRTLEVLFEAGDIGRLFAEDPAGVRIAEARALADESFPGVADDGDVHRFLFTEPISPTVDDDDSAYRVEDEDGTVVDIICGGAGAECSLNESAVTIDDDEFVPNTILTVTLPAIPSVVEPGVPGLRYPLTVISVTAHWNTDNDPLLLEGSDVTIESTAISGPIRPRAESAVHTASTPTAVTVDFTEEVTFGGSADDFRVVADGGDCGDAAVSNGTGVLVTSDDGDDSLVVTFLGDIAAGSYELCVAAGAVADSGGNANVDHTVALAIAQP